MITDNQTIVCAFDFLHKEEIGELNAFADYRTVVITRVPFVAKVIKNVAAEMFEKKVFTTFDDFEFIGFSLGTHIAGVTARLIRTELGHVVSRIFGENYSNQLELNYEMKYLIFSIPLLPSK